MHTSKKKGRKKKEEKKRTRPQIYLHGDQRCYQHIPSPAIATVHPPTLHSLVNGPWLLFVNPRSNIQCPKLTSHLGALRPQLGRCIHHGPHHGCVRHRRARPRKVVIHPTRPGSSFGNATQDWRKFRPRFMPTGMGPHHTYLACICCCYSNTPVHSLIMPSESLRLLCLPRTGTRRTLTTLHYQTAQLDLKPRIP